MHRKIIIAVLCFGCGIGVVRFFPSSEARESVAPAAAVVIPAPEVSTVVEDGNIFTSKGILGAAAGVVELSVGERERLRFGDWAKRDPEAAFEAALKLKVEGESEEMLVTVITSITEEDPHLALELTRNAEELTYTTYYDEIFRAWPQESLMEASLALLEVLERSRESQYSYAQRKSAFEASIRITSRWPEHDTVGLIQWAADFFDHEGQNEGLRAIKLMDALENRDIDDFSFLPSIEDPNAVSWRPCLSRHS